MKISHANKKNTLNYVVQKKYIMIINRQRNFYFENDKTIIHFIIYTNIFTNYKCILQVNTLILAIA